MAKNYFKRYIWLVDLINRRGPISFRDISDAWSGRGGAGTCAKRTTLSGWSLSLPKHPSNRLRNLTIKEIEY